MQELTLSKSIKKTEKNNYHPMTKNVQWWHLFLSFIGTVIAIWGFYYMATKRIEEKAEEKARVFENHEQRIKFLEEQSLEYKEDGKQMKDDIRQILILLQNKQDRK